jgi:hypothetical protein
MRMIEVLDRRMRWRVRSTVSPRADDASRSPSRDNVARAEKLRHAEAPHEEPVRVVGREDEVGRVVTELADHRCEMALRDAALVAADELAGHLGVAGHHAVRGAEADVHQGSDPGRQLLEGAVHRRAEQVQMPDYREPHWPRGRGQPGLLPPDEIK